MTESSRAALVQDLLHDDFFMVNQASTKLFQSLLADGSGLDSDHVTKIVGHLSLDRVGEILVHLLQKSMDDSFLKCSTWFEDSGAITALVSKFSEFTSSLSSRKEKLTDIHQLFVLKGVASLVMTIYDSLQEHDHLMTLMDPQLLESLIPAFCTTSAIQVLIDPKQHDSSTRFAYELVVTGRTASDTFSIVCQYRDKLGGSELLDAKKFRCHLKDLVSVFRTAGDPILQCALGEMVARSLRTTQPTKALALQLNLPLETLKKLRSLQLDEKFDDKVRELMSTEASYRSWPSVEMMASVSLSHNTSALLDAFIEGRVDLGASSLMFVGKDSTFVELPHWALKWARNGDYLYGIIPKSTVLKEVSKNWLGEMNLIQALNRKRDFKFSISMRGPIDQIQEALSITLSVHSLIESQERWDDGDNHTQRNQAMPEPSQANYLSALYYKETQESFIPSQAQKIHIASTKDLESSLAAPSRADALLTSHHIATTKDISPVDHASPPIQVSPSPDAPTGVPSPPHGLISALKSARCSIDVDPEPQPSRKQRPLGKVASARRSKGVGTIIKTMSCNINASWTVLKSLAPRSVPKTVPNPVIKFRGRPPVKMSDKVNSNLPPAGVIQKTSSFRTISEIVTASANGNKKLKVDEIKAKIKAPVLRKFINILRRLLTSSSFRKLSKNTAAAPIKRQTRVSNKTKGKNTKEPKEPTPQIPSALEIQPTTGSVPVLAAPSLDQRTSCEPSTSNTAEETPSEEEVQPLPSMRFIRKRSRHDINILPMSAGFEWKPRRASLDCESSMTPISDSILPATKIRSNHRLVSPAQVRPGKRTLTSLRELDLSYIEESTRGVLRSLLDQLDAQMLNFRALVTGEIENRIMSARASSTKEVSSAIRELELEAVKDIDAAHKDLYTSPLMSIERKISMQDEEYMKSQRDLHVDLTQTMRDLVKKSDITRPDRSGLRRDVLCLISEFEIRASRGSRPRQLDDVVRRMSMLLDDK